MKHGTTKHYRPRRTSKGVPIGYALVAQHGHMPGKKPACTEAENRRHLQARRAPGGKTFVDRDALIEFRKVTAHLYWPGKQYRLHRQRLAECCAEFDAFTARQAAMRRGGRPRSLIVGKPKQRRAA